MIYSIFDKVSKQWSAPFIMTNDETAIRSWKHDCQKVPAEYLGDYDLYAIGYWNPTGLYDSKESEKVLFNPISSTGKNFIPKLILSGSSLVEEEQKSLDFEAGK